MLFSRAVARTAGPSFRMNGVRANSTLPIPPKIATPKSAQGPGGSSARMEGVVGFYKSLPKGDAPQKRGGGIKARYFDGKNASGKPIVATLFTMFLIGYSIDYATHLRKFLPRPYSSTAPRSNALDRSTSLQHDTRPSSIRKHARSSQCERLDALHSIDRPHRFRPSTSTLTDLLTPLSCFSCVSTAPQVTTRTTTTKFDHSGLFSHTLRAHTSV